MKLNTQQFEILSSAVNDKLQNPSVRTVLLWVGGQSKNILEHIAVGSSGL
jgi:hypothetical protein